MGHNTWHKEVFTLSKEHMQFAKISLSKMLVNIPFHHINPANDPKCPVHRWSWFVAYSLHVKAIHYMSNAVDDAPSQLKETLKNTNFEH